MESRHPALVSADRENFGDSRLIQADIDTERPLKSVAQGGHNRWLPSIEPVVWCRSGDIVRIPTWDALNGQLHWGSSADDVSSFDTSVTHPLSGPIGVVGAEPGDLLEVRTIELTPGDFGYTAFSPKFGFLRDEFEHCAFFPWRLSSQGAECDLIPGVRIPNRSFLGIIGVAPSEADYTSWREREARAKSLGQKIGDPELTVGSVVPADGRPGLRTGPPRENGGNLDVRQLRAGSSLFLPVRVPGALLSVGDAHFAQGDGEVCGQAIEMAATADLRIVLHKGAGQGYGSPVYRYAEQMAPPATGTDREDYVATVGLSIDPQRGSMTEDLTVAGRNAVRSMVDFLESWRFDRAQAYAICSVAVDLRVSQAVDVPHVIVSARLPLSIFEDGDGVSTGPAS